MRGCVSIMNAVAKKITYKEEGMNKEHLLILLNHISNQSKHLKKNLHLKINKEIVQRFHEQYDEIAEVKSFIDTLKKEQ